MRRTVCIVRRRTRKALSKWPWRSIFDPTIAKPEELRTELRDEDGSGLGEIVFSKFRIFGKSKASTPWGEAHVESRVWTRVFLGERLLGSFKSPTMGHRMEAVFHNQASLVLHPTKSSKDDYEFSDKEFHVGITFEEGVVPETERDCHLRMTEDEIRRLPWRTRPRSIEGDEYVECSIVLDGTPPIPEDDFIASLAILMSWASLSAETGDAMILKTPSGGG